MRSVCDYCMNEGTDVCFACEPTKFEPVTRIALMRRMDAEELAEFLKSELDVSTPVDWLAWLTDAVTADEIGNRS